MVPRLICMAASEEQLASAEIQASHRNLIARNPGWKHLVFTNEQQDQFVKDGFDADVRDAYAKINPCYRAAKADLFRYLFIYRHGGVYLDVKSTCRLPLDAILRESDSLLLGQWDNRLGATYARWGLTPELWAVPGGEYLNWFFAAAPSNSLIKFAIEKIVEAIHRYEPVPSMLGRRGILRVTGPVAWTQALFSQLSQPASQPIAARIENYADLGLVYSIFDRPDEVGGLMVHRRLFANHYSTLMEPVILGSSARG